MKKYILFFLLVGMFFVTGCEKNQYETLHCTRETTEENYKSIEEITVFYQDDKIKKISQSSTQEMDPSIVDSSFDFGTSIASSFDGIAGFSMKYEKINDRSLKSTITIDYTKLNLSSMKEKLGEDFNEAEFMKAKDMSLEDFKKEELEGYVCK